jgi:hypothetical protein
MPIDPVVGLRAIEISIQTAGIGIWSDKLSKEDSTMKDTARVGTAIV